MCSNGQGKSIEQANGVEQKMITFTLFLIFGITLMAVGLALQFPELYYRLLPRHFYCRKCAHEIIEAERLITRSQIDEAVLYEDREP